MNASFVLVPGHWLGGWAWDRVSAQLRAAGHQVMSVTLPGLGSADLDRSAVTLRAHVSSLTEAVTTAGPDAVVVAHSGAGRVISALLDSAPHSVRRVIYVDSGPTSPGSGEEVPTEVVELPLPTWEEFGRTGASLDGLNAADLEAFRARAVPHPAGAVRGRLQLSNPERRRVPSTIVACSLPAATVQQLAAAGHPMFAEVAQLTDVTFVDLPTGHWPMWSRPDDLAEVLAGAAG